MPSMCFDVHCTIGNTMNHRQKLITIYANGDIINNDDDVTFICNEVVVMRVDKEITLDRLKHGIALKL